MFQLFALRKVVGTKTIIAGFLAALVTLFLAGCKPSESKTEKKSEDTEKSKKDSSAAVSTLKKRADKKIETGRDVLDAMAEVYRSAKSYSDHGYVRLVADAGEQKIDQKVDFSVAFERPNKLRLQAYLAKVVVDGKKLYASIDDLPGQIVEKDAPEELTMKSVYFEPILSSALSSGFAGAAPQLLFLLNDRAIDDFLRNSEEPKLVESKKMDGREYYRVQIRRVEGLATLLIDKESLVLRQMILPTEELRRQLAAGTNTQIESLSLIADFSDAKLNTPIDEQAFQYEVPKDAEIVKYFLPLDPAQLLSKKVPNFKFIDLDGKEITAQSVAGKVVVFDFWATWCKPCRESMPSLQEVYEKYKDNKDVAFFAVSVDEAQVNNKAISELLNEMKVSIPACRDSEKTASAFKFTGIPSRFIIDKNSVVQDYEAGENPNMVKDLTEKIENILAGQNIYDAPLKRYQDELKEYEKYLSSGGEVETANKVVEEAIPQVEIAKQTRPTAFVLSPFWKCTDIKSLGNIMVLTSANTMPRIFVIDNFKAVAEVALDGKVIGESHKLPIGEGELISNLRSYTAPDGKVYFAAFASNQQRCHIFDDKWNLLLSFPEDALQNPHSGIADVQLGDLEGNGVPKIYVGYWGVVGVQAVSMDGKRIWSNRSISNAMRLAFTGKAANGTRDLLCINNTYSTGVIADLDAKGRAQREIAKSDRLFFWIASSDLEGNRQMEYCALSAQKKGESIALGIDLSGNELWSYPLPVGVQPQPIEPIIAGKITKDGPGQWLLPGPDGSINIISANGKHIDSFNYGAALQGMATAEIDGQPVLIVATVNGLEAWKIE